jgi:L-fuculose-phosphate aldolase
MDASAAARAICSAGRRMWLRRLCAGHDGNLSVRLADGLVLCTPTGVSKGRMRPDMLQAVAPDGRVPNSESSRGVTSELKVHLAIYRERPDVRAVVHGHPPHATTFAINEVAPPTGLYPSADAVLGRVALVPYAVAGTCALAENVARCLDSETTTLLLARHGAVTLSVLDVEDAYLRLEVLESYCEMLNHLGPVRRSTAVGRGRESEPAYAHGGA